MKSLRWIRPIFSWLFLVFLTAGLAQDPQRMDEVVRAQAAGNHLMGAVLVAKDGTILFDRAYGLANVEWQVSNTTDTRFRLGSITKQFTAAAILLLEERGKLSTDDPLSKFIPDLPAAWQPIDFVRDIPTRFTENCLRCTCARWRAAECR